MLKLLPVETSHYDDSWSVAGRSFRSRLLLGTGKYKDVQQAAASIRASGAEIITAAIRRVDLSTTRTHLLDVLPAADYTYLPNTAGCKTAEEALRVARLAKAMGGWTLIKLEIISDPTFLLPDMEETLRATSLLVHEGFDVMVYMQDDPSYTKRMQDAGAAALMPLAAPIGSGRGIERPENISRIISDANVPVIVDAGIGTASDAAQAMELGCTAVLMNSAIALAKDPVSMARAMKLAVESGRIAYYAGRMQKRNTADASSPKEGMLP